MTLHRNGGVLSLAFLVAAGAVFLSACDSSNPDYDLASQNVEATFDLNSIASTSHRGHDGPAAHNLPSPARLNMSLAALRRATAKYHRLEVAMADSYGLLEGVDHCFTNQPVGDMGYHYIDGAAIDNNVEETHPEALVYAPDDDGRLHLAAVEYLVPEAAWDAENTGLPSAFGIEFHSNGAGLYVLHAWVWKNNPSGLFEDWNPAVTCD
jgi:hypothetical protein